MLSIAIFRQFTYKRHAKEISHAYSTPPSAPLENSVLAEADVDLKTWKVHILKGISLIFFPPQLIVISEESL